MEMEKAKDTQRASERASEETDNLVHFRCQAIGREMERDRDRDREKEQERGRVRVCLK